MGQKQVPPPSTPYGAPILLEASKKAMAAAEAEATKNNWGVAIAIVDSGGNVVMLQRLDRRWRADLLRRQYHWRDRRVRGRVRSRMMPSCVRSKFGFLPG